MVQSGTDGELTRHRARRFARSLLRAYVRTVVIGSLVTAGLVAGILAVSLPLFPQLMAGALVVATLIGVAVFSSQSLAFDRQLRRRYSYLFSIVALVLTASLVSWGLGTFDLSEAPATGLEWADICGGEPSSTPTIGLLGFEGDPLEAEAKQVAVELAIEDVNASGGIFGTTVELRQSLVPNDGFTSVQLDDLLDAAEELSDVDVVVTLVGSRHSIEVLQNGTIQAPQISGFQTSPELIEIGQGRYFRTVPSDAIQGTLIAEEIMAFGYQRIALIFVDDTYGVGLATAFLDRTRKRSGVEPIIQTTFATASELEEAVGEVATQEPDAIVFFGYGEQAASLIDGLANRGLSGVDYWLSDGGTGVNDELSKIGADPNILTGVRLVVPSPDLNRSAVAAFRERLKDRLGYESEFALASESYDAGVVAALAIAATCADPEQLAEAIVNVSLANSDAAVNCTVSASEAADEQATEDSAPENCLELLWQSETLDLDYNGISGPVDLDSEGEPSRGGYLIRTYVGGEFDLSQSRYVLEATQPEIARTALLPRIEFADGSAEIPASALPNLNQAVTVITQPNVGVISVEGYSSLDGTQEANQALAEARAEAVVSALVERGVPAEKLIAVGRSATDRFPENRVVVFVDQEQ